MKYWITVQEQKSKHVNIYGKTEKWQQLNQGNVTWILLFSVVTIKRNE